MHPKYNRNEMKRLLATLIAFIAMLSSSHAVLKEKDLEQTLSVLRVELTNYQRKLSNQVNDRKQQTRDIVTELQETMKRSNQNALMLYSQHQGYVFDLTYACHEATEQYLDFQRQQLPFESFLKNSEAEVAKYDSLITSLKTMHIGYLSQKAKTDRTVCLTLATNIRNTMMENRNQVADYITFYEMTEERLSYLNDYANKRYNDIQTSIFKNGGENYFVVLKNFGSKISETKDVVFNKYQTEDSESDWGGPVILRLFIVIAFYVIVAVLLNLAVFRFIMPKRFHTQEFLKKRTSIIMATTTVTFAAIMGLLHATLNQYFYIMASSLLIEYAWLLGVVLISLLLRVNGNQIKSAFSIYAPLIVIGFLVIAFRIVLIPNNLVDIIFPPILLLCTIWQWLVIRRHNQNVPRSDMFYTYLSLTIFIVSLCCSWVGYTLLAVQILIWWIMQLACILSITCVSQYLKIYGEKHGLEDKPISKTWFYNFIYKVVLPIMGVLSVMLSIYWAADIFNLSDLCWQLFRRNFIDLKNFNISILKFCMVVNLWFIFSYAASTILSFMRLHYQTQDPTTAASREVMGRNVIQVFVWGVWLMISLSILNISVAWLLAISGGLSTGIGFASKDIIENIYYGASLMAGRIKVGDLIEVDGTMGKVTSISYTSTIIEALSGEVITFQNSQLFAKNYKNLTRNHGYVLAVVPFGVAYGSDIKKVSQLVEDAANNLNLEFIDPSKKATTAMVGLGDSSVDMKLVVWVEAIKRAFVISELTKCIYNTLNENGIEIPFPQRDITIRNAKDLKA